MAVVMDGERQELQDLFWQDELTEAMWWLSAERHVDQIDVSALEQVLWVGATVDEDRVAQPVAHGLVRTATAGTYVLTERGRSRGAALLRADARESVAPEACCGSGPKAQRRALRPALRKATAAAAVGRTRVSGSSRQGRSAAAAASSLGRT